jgi:hypothetical protein
MFDDISVYALLDEIARLKRERDAAIADLHKCADGNNKECDYCKWSGSSWKCKIEPDIQPYPIYCNSWLWRGVREGKSVDETRLIDKK